VKKLAGICISAVLTAVLAVGLAVAVIGSGAHKPAPTAGSSWANLPTAGSSWANLPISLGGIGSILGL
jgi:hypothetical protein